MALDLHNGTDFDDFLDNFGNDFDNFFDIDTKSPDHMDSIPYSPKTSSISNNLYPSDFCMTSFSLYDEHNPTSSVFDTKKNTCSKFGEDDLPAKKGQLPKPESVKQINVLDDDFNFSDYLDIPSSPECSSHSSDSCPSDFCITSPGLHSQKPASPTFKRKVKNNRSRARGDDSKVVFIQENQLSPKKKDSAKQIKQQTKPRRRRQNISRRPGETEAQLKQRRYEAKLKRNRESGKRARKRRNVAIGSLQLEHEQLLKTVHAKRLTVHQLEQENALLQQQLISERASAHPLFNSNSPRARGRRSQEPQAPPLTVFAVAFVALLTWSATLESSSLYDSHYNTARVTPGAKVFQAGAPASLGTPAAAMALESLLQYTLQVRQEYWYMWKTFVQLMTIFAISVCFLGLYPSIIGSRPRLRPRCRRLRSSTRSSTRVSFTSPPRKKDKVPGLQHTHHQRRVITYII